VDRAAWFELDAARAKLVRAQTAVLDRLGSRVAPPSQK
jgi:predicted NUDIX family NTP pyrophosphohydrolase